MAETKSWWKSVTLRKKTKDSAAQQDSSQEHQASHDKTAITTDSNSCQESKHTSLILAGTEYTEHKFENGFNEKTSRRNLKISRSGRFKEKRWVRAGLPENSNFYEDNNNASVSEELH
ncbi:Proline-rich protein 15 [Acipenser ruthenus]|uniref:Proline-rich protein 15 n=2 Tax=Acipenseridae TaxID=7900 RepID=A0A444U0E7_ACIRT|nr:Proline-rich protein 15 [Acipenser ruthenus]